MPRTKASVSKYFKLCPINEGEKLRKVDCMFCGTKLANNGTRMIAHIKKCKNITEIRRENCLKSHNDLAVNGASKDDSEESTYVDINVAPESSNQSKSTRKRRLSHDSLIPVAESPAKIRCQPGGEPGTSRSVTKIQNSNITSIFGNRDCHGGVQSKKKFSSSNNSHKQ